MSLLKLVFFTVALVASCHASGFGHLLPAVRSVPIVRYAPFYNFPTGIRSIHAVASAPLLPGPLPAVSPAPIYTVGPVLPPAAPAPVFPAPVFPAPAFPAPVLPAPTFPAPVLPAPPVLAPAPVIGPALSRFAPLPAYPTSVFPHAIPAPGPVPFGPVVRAVAPVPPPLFTPAAPAPIGVHSHLHLYNKVFAPLPAPFIKQAAWK